MMETIFTTRGDLPIDSLVKKIDVQDQPDGVVTATEYWLGEECVRRDVNVALKPHALFQLEAQEL